MPPRIVQHGRSGLVPRVFLMALAWGVSPLAGQELELVRDYPGSGPYVCPTFPMRGETTAEQQARARQLASDAEAALVVGDVARARALFEQATGVDRGSAEFAYRHARLMEDLAERELAMVEFCRAISLGAEDLVNDDLRARIDALYEAVRDALPEAARAAFAAGIVQADSAFFEGAVSSFTVAIAQAPQWPDPVYNRAVVLERMGLIQESLADFRQFLFLAPDDVDPLVVIASERIGLLEGVASVVTPNPTGALVLGVIPGMGHYYSGRPFSGTLVLAAAGGALAAGIFVKDVTVVCLNPVPAGAACPEPDIVEEVTDRPMLRPAIGIAAAVTLVGAIEALLKAKGRRAAAEAISRDPVPVGARLEPPSVTTRGSRVDLNLLRVVFR